MQWGHSKVLKEGYSVRKTFQM